MPSFHELQKIENVKNCIYTKFGVLKVNSNLELHYSQEIAEKTDILALDPSNEKFIRNVEHIAADDDYLALITDGMLHLIPLDPQSEKTKSHVLDYQVDQLNLSKHIFIKSGTDLKVINTEFKPVKEFFGLKSHYVFQKQLILVRDKNLKCLVIENDFKEEYELKGEVLLVSNDFAFIKPLKLSKDSENVEMYVKGIKQNDCSILDTVQYFFNSNDTSTEDKKAILEQCGPFSILFADDFYYFIDKREYFHENEFELLDFRSDQNYKPIQLNKIIMRPHWVGLLWQDGTLVEYLIKYEANELTCQDNDFVMMISPEGSPLQNECDSDEKAYNLQISNGHEKGNSKDKKKSLNDILKTTFQSDTLINQSFLTKSCLQSPSPTKQTSNEKTKSVDENLSQSPEMLTYNFESSSDSKLDNTDSIVSKSELQISPLRSSIFKSDEHSGNLLKSENEKYNEKNIETEEKSDELKNESVNNKINMFKKTGFTVKEQPETSPLPDTEKILSKNTLLDKSADFPDKINSDLVKSDASQLKSNFPKKISSIIDAPADLPDMKTFVKDKKDSVIDAPADLPDSLSLNPLSFDQNKSTVGKPGDLSKNFSFISNTQKKNETIPDMPADLPDFTQLKSKGFGLNSPAVLPSFSQIQDAKSTDSKLFKQPAELFANKNTQAPELKSLFGGSFTANSFSKTTQSSNTFAQKDDVQTEKVNSAMFKNFSLSPDAQSAKSNLSELKSTSTPDNKTSNLFGQKQPSDTAGLFTGTQSFGKTPDAKPQQPTQILNNFKTIEQPLIKPIFGQKPVKTDKDLLKETLEAELSQIRNDFSLLRIGSLNLPKTPTPFQKIDFSDFYELKSEYGGLCWIENQLKNDQNGANTLKNMFQTKKTDHSSYLQLVNDKITNLNLKLRLSQRPVSNPQVFNEAFDNLSNKKVIFPAIKQEPKKLTTKKPQILVKKFSTRSSIGNDKSHEIDNVLDRYSDDKLKNLQVDLKKMSVQTQQPVNHMSFHPLPQQTMQAPQSVFQEPLLIQNVQQPPIQAPAQQSFVQKPNSAFSKILNANDLFLKKMQEKK